ncbi:RNA polymerase sigma factor [Amycolatopsis sp. 195334CR]|uniref:RNA polymerase sigma factor n=1 Tax=Amycolatopsis sp. 195334CR TaxID=2814588 RepID=UPI001A8CA3C6|nr:sigma-70 family RNA polymerase sigma factor [Amycolatopsis sp. 195334CR]MBN6034138.1 sigma-70 family RNA polymerase sigma factor [Amycolatopsis sp. 195334CR]
MIDKESFTRLYAELHPRVVRYALHRASSDVAHEAVDEAFLVAWRKRDEVPEDGVLPWLLVTTRHVLAEQRRRGRYQDALTAELTRLSAMAALGDVGAAVVERMTVLAALSEIAEKDREALVLAQWDGLTTREAAQVSGCSAAAFAVRLHRARRRFTDTLARLDATPSAGGATKAPINGKVV